MKLLKLIFVLILTLNTASSQIVEFIPRERPIFMISYCVRNPIECKIITSHPIYDSVKITAPEGGMHVIDSVFFYYKYMRECTFVVNNPMRNLTYELWGIGITNPGQNFQVPFDTIFYDYPYSAFFYMKLFVKNGTVTVDSMQVLFKSDMQGNAEEEPDMMVCRLFQNYPNPFGEATHSGNPVTSIEYSVQNSEYVTLKVYDILGKEVAILVNEVKEAGSYTLPFSIYHFPLPSGIYFYELKAGKNRITKKMLLLK